MQKVNKRFYVIGSEDFLWRYLTESQYPFFNKFYKDNWMGCYRRSMHTKEKMDNIDPKKFNWEMCQFPRHL